MTVNPDIAITGFAPDGTNTNWQISYSITNSTSSPFHISIYRSADGVTPDALLTSAAASNTGNGSFNQTVTPNFLDVQQDYFLIAVVDSSNEIAESNESNNSMQFTGGIFQDAFDSSIQVQGTGAADTVTVDETTTVNVTYNGGSAVDFTGTPQVHVRTHDGNDSVSATSNVTSSAWEFGGAGNDTLVGGSANDILSGGAGNDSMTGGSGNDTYLFAGASSLGSDTIVEAANIDSDTVDFSGLGGAIDINLAVTAAQTVNSALLTLTLSNSTGLENVVGTPYNDAIVGNARNNTLTGGAGNDIYAFSGASSLGADTVNESSTDPGIDALDFSGFSNLSNGGITLNLGTTASQALNPLLTLSLSDPAGVENVSGTAFADTLTGNAANNLLSGRFGNDTYVFSGSSILGSDTVAEAATADTNTLDFTNLGAGASVFLRTTGAQQINSLLTLTLTNSAGIQNVLGSAYADSITGNALNNTINGGAGNDTLAGGAGNDTYVFTGTAALGGDTITENSADPGVDTLDFSGLSIGGIGATINLDSSLAGAAQTVVLSSSTPMLVLTLTDPLDIENLVGTSYGDSLTGNSGANTLTGGPGDDTLTGGAGNDTYAFVGSGSTLLGSDTINEAANADTDTLDFSGTSYAVGATISLGIMSPQTVQRSGSTTYLILTLSSTSGIENIVGSAYGDWFWGNSRPNTFWGNAGNDNLLGNQTGAAGNDVFYGGDGNDALSAYGGTNWLYGGSGNDSLYGPFGKTSFLQGGAGNDAINSLGTDTVDFTGTGSAGLGADTLLQIGGVAILDFSGSNFYSTGISLNLQSTAAQIVIPNATAAQSPFLKLTLSLISSPGESVIGSPYADNITADTHNDTLAGGSGNDTYSFSGTSNLGSVSVVDGGDQDNNTLDFSSFSNSTVGGVAVNLGLTSQQTVNSLLKLALSNSAGIQKIIGSAYGDSLTGNALDNILVGGPGNDTLTGGAGNDTYSYSGNTSLGTDTIVEAANEDSDTIDFSGTSFGVGANLNLSSTVAQTVIPNTATTTAPFLTLALSDVAGIENVVGSQYADSITGNDRANILAGGPGNDTLAGGKGNDTYVFAGNVGLGSDTITENTSEGTDTLDFSGESFGVGATINLGTTVAQTVIPSGTGTPYLKVTLSNAAGIENVVGSQYADNVQDNSLNNVVWGGSGNDSLYNWSGADSLYGGDGDDYVYGGGASSFISGGAGNDTVTGTGTSTNATLQGGGGTDTIFVNGADIVSFGGITGVANEVINTYNTSTPTLDFSSLPSRVSVNLGQTMAQTIVPGLLTVTLSQASQINAVIGTQYDDTIVANSANDTLAGGAGSDTYIFSGSTKLGSDTILENPSDPGLNTIDFSGATFSGNPGGTLNLNATGTAQTVFPNTATTSSPFLVLTLASGAAAIEKVVGSPNNDSITGNNLGDSLIGNAGNDTLTGGTGNDTLEGDAGNDSLSAGSGDDTYSFGGSTALGSDTVSDSTSAGFDTLDFSGASFAGSPGASLNLSTTGSAQTVISAGGTTYLSLTLASGASAFEKVVGTSFADSITANSLGDSLEGGAGNDTLTGGSGNDTLEGGTGNDSLAGGNGNDTYLFSGSVALGVDTIALPSKTGGSFDTFDFSALLAGISLNLQNTTAAQIVSPSLLTLTLSDNAINNVVGTNYDDYIVGSSSNDTLSGGLGNDSLDGGAGNDCLFGGLGDDTLVGNTGNDTLLGGLGNDTYQFSGSVGLGSDTITENSGEGIDSLDFSGTSFGTGAVINLLTIGTVQTVIANTATPTSPYLILTLATGAAEVERVVGSQYADSITGNNLNDTLSGGAGNDALVAGTGNTSLIGGDGNDLLTGGSGNDTLEGDTGNDTLAGGTGSDTYSFPGSGTVGLGSDTITDAASGTDVNTIDLSAASFASTGANLNLGTVGSAQTVISAGGTTYLSLTLTSGSAAIQNVIGTPFNDSLTANSLGDSLSGGSGDDTLVSGAGNDYLAGGAGNDSYKFAGSSALGSDTVIENPNDLGNNTLDFSGSSFGVGATLNLATLSTVGAPQTVISASGTTYLSLTLSSGIAAIETVLGSSSADSITANNLGDLLIGNAGNDTLIGGTGSDTLEGDAGDDSLAGNLGNDTYAFVGSGSTLLGSDTITEISGGGTDTIDFSGANYTSVSSGATFGFGAALNLTTTGSAQSVISFSGTTYLALTLSSSGAAIERVVGTISADSITGNSLGDDLVGGFGNDTLVGGAGSDTLEGDAGDDSLTGNGGIDTYLFNGSQALGSDTITEASGTGASGILDFSGASVGAGLALNLGLTSAQSVLGSNLGLTMSDGSGNAAIITSVIGTAYADSITANGLGDLLTGGAGDDTLVSGAGNDTLVGGVGNDTYTFTGTVGLGSDTITESSVAIGIDTLDFSGASFGTLGASVNLGLAGTLQSVIGSNLSLTLSDANGIDNVIGTSNNDSLTGNNLNNVLTGGPGDDTLTGGLGGDTYLYSGSVALGTDTITEAPPTTAIDVIDLSQANFGVGAVLNLSVAGTAQTVISTAGTAYLALVLTDAAGIENVVGTSSADSITGNGLNNVLVGGAGNDTLVGGQGDDTLEGDAGDDSLLGGIGNDTYAFPGTGSSTLGTDTITENTGEGTDTLDFSGSTFTGTPGLGLNLATTAATQTVISGVLNINLAGVGEI